MNKTLEYYKMHANEYIESTINVDMSESYKKIEKYLKEGNKILDLGAGSGRDSLYFISKGYDVVAIDIVSEFVDQMKVKGIDARLEGALDMKYYNEFDAIYSSASLLHLKRSELSTAFENCYKALKDNGVMYLSVKYGDFEGEIDGRYFTYLTEESIKKHLGNFNVEEVFITGDKLANRDLRWLNMILKK